MSARFEPTPIFIDSNDVILARLFKAIEPYWGVMTRETDFGPVVVVNLEAGEYAKIKALGTQPIIPQLVNELIRVARFYEETAAFLETHADEIIGDGTQDQQAQRKAG